MAKKETKSRVKTTPLQEIRLENLDVHNVPKGGILVRLPLFPEEVIVRDEFQPRTKFTQAKMDRLRASLAAMGQKQYPTVRWQIVRSKIRFVLDDGERRTRCYRELGWKEALYVVLPEEYKPKYDPNRELGQAAANAAQEKHTPGEIVRLTQRIVNAELADRKTSGASEYGAIQIALAKVDQAFGEKPGWSKKYHTLGRLSDELLDMLDSDEGEEAPLRWGDALSLASAPQEMQDQLLKDARSLFPNDPNARRTYISRQSRQAREGRGEKVRGRASDEKKQFLQYPTQLKTLGTKSMGGRGKEDYAAYVDQVVKGMRITELEGLLRELKRGLGPFVQLLRAAKAAREQKLEDSGLKFEGEGGIATLEGQDD